MSNETSVAERTPCKDKEPDLVWGAAAIGAEINRSTTQVYDLLRTGALKGVVGKLGHRTLVASRSKLRDLPFLKKGK